METIEEILGAAVRDLRSKAKISQSDLAESAATSLSTIQRFESGEHLPNSKTIKKIAGHFGLSVPQLLATAVGVALRGNDFSERFARLSPEAQTTFSNLLDLTLGSSNKNKSSAD